MLECTLEYTVFSQSGTPVRFGLSVPSVVLYLTKQKDYKIYLYLSLDLIKKKQFTVYDTVIVKVF